MINSANIPDTDFLTSRFYAKDFYNISLNEEDFVEKAMRGWRKMKATPSMLYIYKAKVSGGSEVGMDPSTDLFAQPELEFDVYSENRRVRLPENCMWIEQVASGTALTDQYGDIVNIYSNTNLLGYKSHVADILSGNPKYFTDTMQKTPQSNYGEIISFTVKEDSQGKYIELFDDRFNGYDIEVMYRGIVIDDDGLPKITETQAEALAAWVAHIEARKEFHMNVPGAIDRMQSAKADYGKLFQQAAIPEFLTDNDIDQLLNVATSFDRKAYNFAWVAIRH